MYIRKNELIKRLISLTGKTRDELVTLTVKELASMYENCILKEKRIYIEVTYKDKNIVKLLGAKYDGEEKKWYIPQGVEQKIFNQWI